MSSRRILVALDDGHGIDTPGKRTPPIPELDGRVIFENEFNEAVILLLDKELRRCGIDTIFTAPEKKDVSLAARVKRANDANADAFVSVHYNAYDAKFGTVGGDPEGLEVFHSPGSVKGKQLATAIYNELKQGTPQKLRGVKTAAFYVLQNTKMPAALSENGFMDSKREALLMIDKNFQKEVAVEHAKGLCKYFGVRYIPETIQPSVPAQPTSPFIVRITANELNVRDQAVVTSKINTVVKKGQAYTIVEVNGQWGKLKSGAGWIHLGYTETISGTKPTAPQKSPTQPKPKSFLVKVNTPILNVRQSPSTSSKINTTVRKGQVYTIVEVNGQWGKLKSGAGWIHLNYTYKI